MTPIHCSEQNIDAAHEFFCNKVDFPCKYLGLPLSARRLPKEAFLELIDKIANKLQDGRLPSFTQQEEWPSLVKSVLTAIPIYHLIALQCPKWVIKSIDKILRGFLWKGRNDIKGDHCIVGWARVCRPLSLGGLGIHNLETLGWALVMR